ncbi:hypothetical protein PG994_004755 [Apiospora phragmitis]|uniref:Uncharacterized protein n=1 Tax=Apiospora phragmitis TaxID=2905665 RepID=A0ABR1VRH9_9PEZI
MTAVSSISHIATLLVAFVADGAGWVRHRKATAPAFSEANLCPVWTGTIHRAQQMTRILAGDTHIAKTIDGAWGGMEIPSLHLITFTLAILPGKAAVTTHKGSKEESAYMLNMYALIRGNTLSKKDPAMPLSQRAVYWPAPEEELMLSGLSIGSSNPSPSASGTSAPDCTELAVGDGPSSPEDASKAAVDRDERAVLSEWAARKTRHLMEEGVNTLRFKIMDSVLLRSVEHNSEVLYDI